MKKFLITLIVVFIIIGGVYTFLRLTSVEDTWIQDKATGAWARHGNPSGPAPEIAVRDCYARAGSAHEEAVRVCVPRLCAGDEVCINDLLDAFESFKSRQSSEVGFEPAPSPTAETPAPAPAASTEVVGGAGGDEAARVPSAPDQGQTPPEAAPLPTPPEETPPPAATSNEMIRLTSPSVNAALTSPFQVAGDVAEGVTRVIVRVKGANGVTVIEETLTPRAPAEAGWRSFKITLAYDFDSTKAGSVEVAPQGGEAVSVPVVFQ